METRVVYEDFAPSHKLVREEGIETLVVELPGFKKEEIRVQLESFGNLSISGERSLADNRRSRFRNVFQFPEDCNEVRSRFEDGRLYVKALPKLITETSMEPTIKIKETGLKDRPTQAQKPKENEKPASETKPSTGKVDVNRKVTPRPSVGPSDVPKKKEDEKRVEPTDTRKHAEKVLEREKDQTVEKKGKEKVARVVYEDFVPLYKLVREEGIETFVVELSGFKKEDIRVQLESFGNLSISGERPLADNRRSRFRSVFQFPEDCNEIRSRFEDGRLYVKALPKLITETSMESNIKMKETGLKEPPKQAQKPKEKEKPVSETKPSTGKDDVNQKAPSRPSVEPSEVPPKKKEDEKRVEPNDTSKDAGKEVEIEKDRIEEKKDEEKLMVPESGLGFYKPMQILVNVIVALLVLVVMALYVTSKN